MKGRERDRERISLISVTGYTRESHLPSVGWCDRLYIRVRVSRVQGDPKSTDYSTAEIHDKQFHYNTSKTSIVFQLK